MSATIDTALFEQYFKEFKTKVIEISGRTYPITSHFTDETISHRDMLKYGVDTTMKILNEDDVNTKHAHDILFFITSKNESHGFCKMLSSLLHQKHKIKYDGQDDIFCVEVYAGMNPVRQNLAQDKDLYKEDSNYTRKIVVATNVAESSLTIDGIRYVIDSGLELSTHFDPVYRAKILDIKQISYAQAKQRMGRGGRTEPGICYHMYTKKDMEHMDPYPEPDIRTHDLSAESLRLLNTPRINNIKELLAAFVQFIEPPRDNYIKCGINILAQLDAVYDGMVTPLGKMMNTMGGNNPMASIAIIYATIYNCLDEVVTLMSITDAIHENINAIFIIPRREDPEYKEKFKKFDKVREKFKHKYGDHHSLLNIYNKYIEKYNNDPDTINVWCENNFLKSIILSKVKKYATRKLHNLKRIIDNKTIALETDINPNVNILDMELDDRILISLIHGYRINDATLKMNNFYKTRYSGNLVNIRLSRFSFLTLRKKLPKYVFFNELVISRGRPGLNIVSIVPNKIIDLLN